MTFRQSLSDRVAAVLGRRIVEGEYVAGNVLPPEADLLSEFGVSRTVLREAMKTLSSKGLVEVKQKVGTRATSRESWALLDPDLLAWQIEATKGDQRGLLRSLTEVRAIIEPAAAQLAARRATNDEVTFLRDALDDMAKAIEAKDDEAFIEADLRFHTGILVSCHNLLLLQMNATVGSALRMSRDVTIQVPKSSEASLPLHKALLDRIAARQPIAARRASERLIGRTKSDITAVLPGVDLDDE